MIEKKNIYFLFLLNQNFPIFNKKITVYKYIIYYLTIIF